MHWLDRNGRQFRQPMTFAGELERAECHYRAETAKIDADLRP